MFKIIIQKYALRINIFCRILWVSWGLNNFLERVFFALSNELKLYTGFSEKQMVVGAVDLYDGL